MTNTCKILDPTQHNCLIPLTSTTGSAVSGYIICDCGPFQHRWFGLRLYWLRPLLVARRSDRTAQSVSAPSSCVFIWLSAIPLCLTHLVAKWVTLEMFPLLCYQWLGGLKFFFIVCQWWQKFTQRSKKGQSVDIFYPKKVQSLMW